MLDLHWFLRMSQWARRKPSWTAFKVILLVLAICVALYAVEQVFGWPDALTPDRFPRRGGPPVTEL